MGVTSPSAVATPPRSVLSSAQILRIPSTTAGRSDEFKNCVWFVWMKLLEGLVRTTLLHEN